MLAISLITATVCPWTLWRVTLLSHLNQLYIVLS